MSSDKKFEQDKGNIPGISQVSVMPSQDFAKSVASVIARIESNECSKEYILTWVAKSNQITNNFDEDRPIKISVLCACIAILDRVDAREFEKFEMQKLFEAKGALAEVRDIIFEIFSVFVPEIQEVDFWGKSNLEIEDYFADKIAKKKLVREFLRGSLYGTTYQVFMKRFLNASKIFEAVKKERPDETFEALDKFYAELKMILN